MYVARVVIIRGLREQIPRLAVQLTQLDTPAQIATLRDGEIDLGLIRSTGTIVGIGIADLFSQPMMLVSSDIGVSPLPPLSGALLPEWCVTAHHSTSNAPLNANAGAATCC